MELMSVTKNPEGLRATCERCDATYRLVLVSDDPPGEYLMPTTLHCVVCNHDTAVHPTSH